MSETPGLEVRLKSITFEAEGISSFEFLPRSGKVLPAFSAGAHIDLQLPNGMTRSYSLVNPQGETHRYVVATNKDPASRGGSRYMHETLKVGDVLSISAPRNNFPLVEDADGTVLFAGGIGITPLWCMIQRLEKLGRPWTLYYSTRTRNNAAFLEPLSAMGSRAHVKLHLNFDQEPGGKMLDLGAIIGALPADSHLYCCGPLPMLAAFESATGARDPARVHLEYFSAKSAPAAAGGFSVELARSGRTVFVPEGKTILDALLDAGIDAPYSCMEGICGTCETKVVSGIPDHRDLVLSRDEQAASKTMMICCSGSKSEKLVLDL